MDIDIKKITDYMFMKSKSEKADLIFVFGTRHKEVVYKALEIYSNGLAKKIIISGGVNKINGVNEAKTLSENLIGLGVKAEDIIIEDRSTNSLENVIFSKKIIEKEIGFKNIKKIIVVTKNYHIKRVLMTFKKHFSQDIEFLPISYDIGFTRENWFKNNLGKSKVLSEYEKIHKYLKKGDIAQL